MSTTVLAEAPADAPMGLAGFENSDFLLIFRSLPWDAFLKNYISELLFEVAKTLMGKLVNAIEDEFEISVSVDVVESDPSLMEVELLGLSAQPGRESLCARGCPGPLSHKLCD